MLVTQARHAVIRRRVSVVFDAMTTITGVKLFLADDRVARGMRTQWETQAQRRACKPRQAIRSRKHLVLRTRGNQIRALMLKSERANCHWRARSGVIFGGTL